VIQPLAKLLISGLILAASLGSLIRLVPNEPTKTYLGEGYRITELPYFGNAHIFATVGFNDEGQIAGYCENSQAAFTAHLIDGKNNIDLHSLPGYTGSSSYGLNRLGAVVGICYNPGQDYATRPTVGCIWKKGKIVALRPLPGLPDSRAWALDDAETVVGLSYDPGTNPRSIPTVWINHAPQALPLPEGAASGEARNINRNGMIVGTITLANGLTRACLWSHGVSEVLAPLREDENSRAVAINSGGTVAGQSGQLAVQWIKGRPLALSYPGAPNLVSIAINDLGDMIVNDQAEPINQDVEDDPALPLLYRHDRGFVRISRLVPSGNGHLFVKGMGLNNRGQILAGAFVQGTEAKMIVLSPN
jgi:hypothetical protein